MTKFTNTYIKKDDILIEKYHIPHIVLPRAFCSTLVVLLFSCFCVSAQTKTEQSGGWAKVEIENGDTLYTMSLQMVTISARRKFKSSDERRKYHLYKRCAKVSYPYAMEALVLFKDLEEQTEGMGKKKARRKARKAKRALKGEFKSKLKKLTKTQGYILIKMIERQTGESFYTTLKDTQGGVNAAYWQNMSKMFGYDLKDKYEYQKDPLLDEILLDYDLGPYLYDYEARYGKGEN